MGRARVLQEEPVFVERCEVCQRRIKWEISERYYWFVENPGDWTVHGERGGIDCVWDTRAAIDGNVNRVLTRVRRIRGDPVKEKKTVDAIKRVAWELIGKEEEKEEDVDEKKEDAKSKNRPGDFNQAMMELGATVCKPKTPRVTRVQSLRFVKGTNTNYFPMGKSQSRRIRKSPRKRKSAGKRLQSR